MATLKTRHLALAAMTSIAGMAIASPNVVVQVRDNYGRLLPDAKVTLVGPERSSFRTYTATTDRLGSATLRPRDGGRFVIFVTRDEFQIQNRDLNVSEDRTTLTDFSMKTADRPKILVFVRSDDSNEGISGANVLLRTGNSGREQRFTTKSGGYATIPIENDPYARYTFDVSHPDFETSGSISQSRSRGDRLIVFNLRRGNQDRVVSLRVVDSRTKDPIRNARVTLENGSDRRTVNTDSDGRISVRLAQRANYRLTIESNSYNSISDRIDLGRPESSTFTRTFELRPGNGGPVVGPGGAYQRGAKLGGDLRLKKSHYKYHEPVALDLGVMFSEYAIERLNANVNVQLYGPSGRSMSSQSFRMDLNLNALTRKNVDLETGEPGTYTIRVSASGNNMRSWTSEKTFVVDRDYAVVAPEGSYSGKVDVQLPGGGTQVHTINLSVKKKNSSLYEVSGSMGPGRNDGFHIRFTGTYDIGRKDLRAFGDVTDDPRKWDAKLTGGLNNSGRMVFVLDIRSLDGKYNRSVRTELTKD